MLSDYMGQVSCITPTQTGSTGSNRHVLVCSLKAKRWDKINLRQTHLFAMGNGQAECLLSDLQDSRNEAVKTKKHHQDTAPTVFNEFRSHFARLTSNFQDMLENKCPTPYSKASRICSCFPQLKDMGTLPSSGVVRRCRWDAAGLIFEAHTEKKRRVVPSPPELPGTSPRTRSTPPAGRCRW